MKKIFAISVLSLLAVVGADNAFALPYKEPFYTAARIEQEIGQATAGMLTNKNIINSNETTTSPDYDAPSVTRMENTVNAAVATKVDNEQIVKADGTTTLAGTTVDATTLDKDTVAPTIANVEAKFVPKENVAPMEAAEEVQQAAVDVQSGEFPTDQTEVINSIVPSVGAVAGSFVPNVATTYKDDYFGDVSNEMHPGLYTIMVEVDESGNKTFIWQAVQQTRQSSSVGGQMPN